MRNIVFIAAFFASFFDARRLQPWEPTQHVLDNISASASLHNGTAESSQGPFHQLRSLAKFLLGCTHGHAFNPCSLGTRGHTFNPSTLGTHDFRGDRILVSSLPERFKSWAAPAVSMSGDELLEKSKQAEHQLNFQKGSISQLWGSVDGKDVHLVTLKSDMLEVDVCSLGAALSAVRVNVKGEWLDVILGYESLEKYTNGGKANFGTVVGRVANRIANGSFHLNGHTFYLEKNNGPHHIHGGTSGFYSQVFAVADASSRHVTLTLQEPDGNMGYPGQVNVSVTYTVKEGELHFEYTGVSDKPTLLSLTNHGYWNLKGHHKGNVLDHTLQVMASKTTLTDDTCRITGELEDVQGTRLDFREPKVLQKAFDVGGPIDRNFCLDTESGKGVLAARLVGPNRLTMEVWTDQPGLQVFTGENIATAGPASWWSGKGAQWQQFGAISLEPQLWPDGIHHSHFKSPVLRPGETYRHHSWHAFSVQD